tara:strand:- start:99 stop:311 length:213 start_codon:yes stop_codon:yes gene_type:complete
MTKRIYRKYKVSYSMDHLDPNPITKKCDDWDEVIDFIDSLELLLYREDWDEVIDYSLLKIKEFDDNWNEL